MTKSVAFNCNNKPSLDQIQAAKYNHKFCSLLSEKIKVVKSVTKKNSPLPMYDDTDVEIILQEDKKYEWSKDEMVLGMTQPSENQPVITHYRPPSQLDRMDEKTKSKSASWKEYDEKWRKDEEDENLEKSLPTLDYRRPSFILIPKASRNSMCFLPISKNFSPVISNRRTGSAYIYHDFSTAPTIAYEVNGMVYYGIDPKFIYIPSCRPNFSS